MLIKVWVGLREQKLQHLGAGNSGKLLPLFCLKGWRKGEFPGLGAVGEVA